MKNDVMIMITLILVEMIVSCIMIVYCIMPSDGDKDEKYGVKYTHMANT